MELEIRQYPPQVYLNKTESSIAPGQMHYDIMTPLFYIKNTGSELIEIKNITLLIDQIQLSEILT